MLKNDVVRAVRELVAACRVSVLRREAVQDAIKEANLLMLFGTDEDGRAIVINELTQLLRDVDVQWSSTFLMIDRLLEIYPVSNILT